MRYQVTWSEVATIDLAAIWTEVPDKSAVSKAANRIDELLRQSPDTVGVDNEGERLLRVDPLEVVYSHSSLDLIVHVTQVVYRRLKSQSDE